MTVAGLKAAIARNQRQLVRFGVGGLATIVADYGTFYVLYTLASPLFVATAVSLMAGFVVSFTLNRLWVFGADKAHAQKRTTLQFVLYSGLFVCNIGFAYLFIWQAQQLGVNAYIAKLLTIPLIVGWNFVIYKRVIFALNEPRA